MQKQDKEILFERLKKSGLFHKTLSLSGREIVIHETTGHSSRKRGALAMQIEQDESLSEDVKNSLATLYVPLMSCSEGDVPESYDDFFWMKDADIETWVREARQINPPIFALLDAQEERLKIFMSSLQEQEAETEKKSVKRKRSRRS